MTTPNISTGSVHLVVGSTGAGKTTFVRQLARQVNGVGFVIDDWMIELFFPDRPTEASSSWYMERIRRCTARIWATSQQVLRAGVDVVLEVGLTRKSDRQAFYSRGQDSRTTLLLYVVTAPLEVRWKRVQARNEAQAGTYAMHVTREMFDFVERMWQPPEDAELARHRGTRVAT